MSISSEIEVATIRIADAAMTLENKVTIALPSQTSLTMLKNGMTAKKSAKNLFAF